MKTIISSVLLFCIIFQSHNVLSQNIFASQIQYKPLKNDVYEFEFQVLRDCHGAALNLSDCKIHWFIDSDTGYTQADTLSVNRLIRSEIKDVTPTCNNIPGPCNPQNSPDTAGGVERHTIQMILDLSKPPFSSLNLGTQNCKFGIAFSAGKRSSAFTTISSGSEQWTRLVIDFCALQSCNKILNSSMVTEDIPFSFAMCNQTIYNTTQYGDTADFDSLSTQLVPALSNYKGVSVNYSNPFSFQYPVTPYCIPSGVTCTPNLQTNPVKGFYFDDLIMVFTPVNSLEKSLVAYNVNEWRKDKTGNWRKISSCMREYVFYVISADYNYAPTIQGPTINNVCEGDKICFNISGNDAPFSPYQTVPDTVNLKWNRGIPGATFVVTNPKDREKTAQFCWQTRVGQASDISYSFVVTASDDHCLKPLYSVKGFKVKVNQRAFGTRKFKCLHGDSLIMEMEPAPGNSATMSYKWSVRDSAGVNTIYNGTQKKDTGLLYPGKNIIVSTINNQWNCPTVYMDTIYCYPSSVNPISGVELGIKNPVNAGEVISLGVYQVLSAHWYSADGSLVFEQKNICGQLSVPDVKPGIYLLWLNGENIDYHTRMVVQP